MKTLGTTPMLGWRVLPFVALASGCISHSVSTAPIEIKPIFITMDINLRVQRELDEFFDFEKSAAAAPRPSTDKPTKVKP
ncbi:MAG: hypothetical protein ABIP94_05370 [Planctomycetota bacterium]